MNVQPVTRDVSEIVRACEIVEAELRFQADRLSNVRPEASGSDPEHLDDLREGYGNSARYVGILKRYQEGRLPRVRGEGAPEHASEGVDTHGRAVAFVEG